MAERPHVIAMAVAELQWGRDTAKEIAARYGITDRTLRNWRESVDTDLHLTELYRAALATLLEGWRASNRRFIVKALASLEDALPDMEPGDRLAALRIAIDHELKAQAIARRTGITVDEAPVYPPPDATTTRRLDS